jgi:hypothetical protein
MISLAELFGFQPQFDRFGSDAPVNLPKGPPWTDALLPSTPPFATRPSWPTLPPSSVDLGGAFTPVGSAEWSPKASTVGSPWSPIRSPPQLPSSGILGGLPAVRANGAGGGILQQYTDWGPGPSVQQAAISPSALIPFDALSFGHLVPPASPSTNVPVPAPQASWAAPQLPLFPAESRGDTFNAGQAADDSSVLSDIDQDAWLPNAQYANRGARRGGRRASEPELSPAEEIRWTIYNHNLDVLGELEPQNRLLFSIHNGRWVPSPSHLRRLTEEIERARAEQGRSDLEPHHNLPRAFREFGACGLDIEDYVTYVARDLHRLRPNGLHTGSENWNKIWRRYFAEQQTSMPSEEQAEEIFKQLIQMWDKASWLRR